MHFNRIDRKFERCITYFYFYFHTSILKYSQKSRKINCATFNSIEFPIQLFYEYFQLFQYLQLFSIKLPIMNIFNYSSPIIFDKITIVIQRITITMDNGGFNIKHFVRSAGSRFVERDRLPIREHYALVNQARFDSIRHKS